MQHKLNQKKARGGTFCVPIFHLYHMAQRFDGKNFDKLIVGFKGETLRDKGL